MRSLAAGLLIGCLLSSCAVGSAGELFEESGFENALRAPPSADFSERFSEPIETDRHDFTQSSRTIGRGVSQLEYGYLYFYKDKDEEIDQTHVTPELMLRYGITDDVEFQIRWNYAWRFPDGEDTDDLDSAEDMRMGLKIDLWEQERWIPETALEVRTTAPTGGNAWTTNRVEVGGALI